MPYISEERREALDDPFVSPASAGELNYAITRLLCDYCGTKGLSYQSIDECLGALEGAKLEFYRRLAVPYEETKIKLNGDIEYYAGGVE